MVWEGATERPCCGARVWAAPSRGPEAPARPELWPWPPRPLGSLSLWKSEGGLQAVSQQIQGAVTTHCADCFC